MAQWLRAVPDQRAIPKLPKELCTVLAVSVKVVLSSCRWSSMRDDDKTLVEREGHEARAHLYFDTHGRVSRLFVRSFLLPYPHSHRTLANGIRPHRKLGHSGHLQSHALHLESHKTGTTVRPPQSFIADPITYRHSLVTQGSRNATELPRPPGCWQAPLCVPAEPESATRIAHIAPF